MAIGANSAVFALVNAALLSPLPFPDPARLVTVNQTRADAANEPLSIPDYRDLRDGNRSFEALSATFQWSANLTGGEAERVQGMKASASFFAMLGAKAALGRTLLPGDEQGSGAKVVVLTHRFWLRRFGGSPAALDASLVLNGDAYAIVGVLPAAFITPVRDAEVIAPFPMDADPRRASRDAGFLRVTGRLRPGVTIEQARTGSRRDHGAPAGRVSDDQRDPPGDVDRRMAERAGRDAAVAAAAPAGRGRAGPARRLRQRRQPVPRRRDPPRA